MLFNLKFMLKENCKINIYILCFLIGFISCWYIFNINFLFKIYESFLKTLTHRRLVYFILFLFIAMLSYFFNKIVKLFATEKNVKIINFLTSVFAFLIMLLTYFLCEKFVKNWKIFTIHTLNYMLYAFAWYSLIKAMKVWCKYGNFFDLLLQGKIKIYIIKILISITSLSILLFWKKLINPLSAIGMLLISMFILMLCCLIFTISAEHLKKINAFLKKIKTLTDERISRKEQPKEVSIVYDQMSAIGMLSFAGKRIFDISRNADLQFIVSKLFKMLCYLISLSTTCKYTGQIKKLRKSITFFILVAIFLLCLAYNETFHAYLVQKPQISRVANYIIDYLFFPLGIVKILIQIFTIIFAKKTTGISVVYFLISAYFTVITSCNLIAKGNFCDTTITLSILKCFLYLSLIFIVMFINKHYSSGK